MPEPLQLRFVVRVQAADSGSTNFVSALSSVRPCIKGGLHFLKRGGDDRDGHGSIITKTEGSRALFRDHKENEAFVCPQTSYSPLSASEAC